MNFRKKYSLTLLLFAGGTALAFKTGADLSSYTAFALALLTAFGAADLIDKNKIRQLSERDSG